jgi:DNA polymerase-3 subunit epsilon
MIQFFVKSIFGCSLIVFLPKIHNRLYAIIDIETTGQSAANGKITEIAIFVHNGFQITDSFSSLINPECYIPGFITSLTGIDNEMVRDAPKFYEIARQIVEITHDKIFVAHNVSFDYKFIQEEFKRLGYDYQRKTMCTVRMGRKFLPGHKSYSLGKICDELGISINGRHRAAGDALATTKLFEIILERKAQKETKQPPGQLRLF